MVKKIRPHRIWSWQGLSICLLKILLAGVPTLTLATSGHTGELRVSVDGVRNKSGNLRVALFHDPESFATKDGRYKEVVIPAREGNIEAVFREVPVGTYGLAAFHDENDNVLFDKNFIGFPEEGFGFGNDAPVFLGPPDFLDAAVIVAEEIRHVSLTLRYW